MKLIILLLLLSTSVFAWENESYSEDSNYQYWTGISSPRETLNEALTEAYDNALNESVKYNFGFNQKITESTYQNLKEINMYKENHVETPTVQFKNVLPIKQNTKQDKNGKFIAYRLLRYEKKSIEAEKTRLSTIQSPKIEKELYNLVIENNQGNKLGKVSISTYPENAEIKLTPLDKKNNNKDFYISSNKTEFVVPLGAYRLDVIKSGYKLDQRDVLISGKEQTFKISLEQEDSWIDFNIFPKDAVVYLNNNRQSSLKKIKVKPNEVLSVKIMHPDYFEESFTISVLPADYKVVRKELSPKKSAFRILSTPSEATVFANGVEIGTTPILNYDSQASSIEFVIVKKGFAPQTRILPRIKANTVIDPITFDLKSL